MKLIKLVVASSVASLGSFFNESISLFKARIYVQCMKIEICGLKTSKRLKASKY